MLSREVCCNVFGVAWGQPCQMCNFSRCGKGYEYINSVCRGKNNLNH